MFNQRKSTLAYLVKISLKPLKKKDVKIVIKSYMEMLVLIVNLDEKGYIPKHLATLSLHEENMKRIF